MNFKKGDKVKFLNENDYGTVTRVMDNGIVMVLNSDDFEVPAKTSQLILDPNSTETQEVTVDDRQAKVQVKIDAKKSDKVQKTVVVSTKSKIVEAPSIEKDTYGIYIGFVPSNGSKALDKCDLDLYFVNDSNFRICYNFMRPNAENSLFRTEAGILEPDTKEYVDTIKREDLNDLTYFKFQFLYSKDGWHSAKQPEEFDVKINPVKFYQSSCYKENDFFDEDAVVISIKQNSEMLEAAQKLSPSSFYKDKVADNKPKKPAQKASDKEIVDLHLTEIIDDERGMSPKDMLDYQMKVFREKMNEYIKNPNVKKVVFIHGKGNGTLKLEIIRTLKYDYKRYEYQDASFEEYGGGATLVYVK